MNPSHANGLRRMLLVCLFVIVPEMPAQDTGADRPLRLSENHRYLVGSDDEPFLLQGDAAWSLIANLTKEDAVAYLRDRRAKGFNTIVVNLIEHKFGRNAPRNIYGDAPFPDMNDWSVQNEAYFKHADWVIREAAKNGITVLLFPIYLGYEGKDEGFVDEAMANGPEKLLAYGQFLGRRYRSFDNIIWVMGGDRDPGPAREDVDMVAFGIRQYDRRHMFSAHCHSDSDPVVQYPGPWLDIIGTYPYQIVHEALIGNYNRKPVMPFFLLETIYEGEHNASQVQIRRQAYWAALCGGFGQVMGNAPIWLFGTGWRAALDSPGSVGMMHWGRLFRSRRWFDLVPDQDHKVVTNGLGEFWGLDYLTAAATADGSTLIAYMPTERTVTVDLTRLPKGQTHAWWFNPRTGSADSIGIFPTSGPRQFTPPAMGDWVLVLDDASRQLGAPGAESSPAPLSEPQPGMEDRRGEKEAALAAHHYDLFLIGDSIIQNLENPGFKAVWDRFFAPRNAIDLGFSGGRTENTLWNLTHGELRGQSPKVAVLLIGTNDADDVHFDWAHTPEQIRDGVAAILNVLREKTPATKVLLLRIFPRQNFYRRPDGTEQGSEAQRAASVLRAGELLSRLADGNSVRFLDLNSVFVRPDGTIDPGMMPDLLHPSPAGALAWARAMEPALSGLMGDAPRG